MTWNETQKFRLLENRFQSPESVTFDPNQPKHTQALKDLDRFLSAPEERLKPATISVLQEITRKNQRYRSGFIKLWRALFFFTPARAESRLKLKKLEPGVKFNYRAIKNADSWTKQLSIARGLAEQNDILDQWQVIISAKVPVDRVIFDTELLTEDDIMNLHWADYDLIADEREVILDDKPMVVDIIDVKPPLIQDDDYEDDE